MGAFNDNYFKQAASLMAIAAMQPKLQGYAAVVFTLPFILFAAPAGYLSDKYPKRNIVIGSKALELAAMLFGAAGMYYLNWPLILTMVGVMGLQATIFSPALNGSIPELYPQRYVLRANSVMKMVTTSAILLGIVMAGLALGHKQAFLGRLTLGQTLVAGGAVAVAILGLLASLWVVRRPAAAPGTRFPWSGPIDTVRILWEMRKDRLLTTVIWADAYVWFVAALQILIINRIGISQFQMGETHTSYLVMAELAGVATGGLLCGRLASGGSWFRVLCPAAIVLACAMAAIMAAPKVPWMLLDMLPARPLYLGGILLIAGIAGGILLVPLESFIQARPPPQRKGQIIAAGNFTAFLGIMISGLVFNLLDSCLTPTTAFGAMALPTLLAGLWLFWALPSGEGE
jgi:MFS family permease